MPAETGDNEQAVETRAKARLRRHPSDGLEQ
jgi:hypothetical protein